MPELDGYTPPPGYEHCGVLRALFIIDRDGPAGHTSAIAAEAGCSAAAVRYARQLAHHTPEYTARLLSGRASLTTIGKLAARREEARPMPRHYSRPVMPAAQRRPLVAQLHAAGLGAGQIGRAVHACASPVSADLRAAAGAAGPAGVVHRLAADDQPGQLAAAVGAAGAGDETR